MDQEQRLTDRRNKGYKRGKTNGERTQEDSSSKREGHKMETEKEDRKDRRDRSGREDKMEMRDWRSKEEE